jgi:hypothetical protein
MKLIHSGSTVNSGTNVMLCARGMNSFRNWQSRAASAVVFACKRALPPNLIAKDAKNEMRENTLQHLPPLFPVEQFTPHKVLLVLLLLPTKAQRQPSYI